MMDYRFERIDSATQIGGGFRGTFTASYKQLVTLLGPPTEVKPGRTDGKISTSWKVFDNLTGIEFEVYDYKMTNLYSREMPSVEEFRNMPSYDWHVRGAFIPSHVIDEFAESVKNAV
jgi:hypothetical protein